MRIRPYCLLVLCLGATACPDATENATECSKHLSELKDLCPAGTSPKLSSVAHGDCGGTGEFRPSEKSGEVSGRCVSDGRCEVECVGTGDSCPCGVASIGKDEIKCRTDCDPGCGDGSCEDAEDAESCPGDCAKPDSGNEGGTTGSGDTTGSGEATGAAGSDATGSGGSTKCTEAAKGWYVIRKDGHLLAEAQDESEVFVTDASGVALTGVVDAMGGAHHGCALLDNGSVWCWRDSADYGNRSGQLGNGITDTDKSAAVHRASQVLVDAEEPLSDVSELVRGSADHVQTCAITRGGNLYCWGDLTWLTNEGTYFAWPYATQIMKDGLSPLEGVVQASVSPTMACAIVEGETGNEAYCWGANDYVNLGNGDTTRQRYPTRVTSLSSPTRVAVVTYKYALSSGGSACAVDNDQIRCWGANNFGLTGSGTTASTVASPTPVVIDEEGAKALPAPVDLIGGSHAFCALSADKNLWCWGGGFKPYATKYGGSNVSSVGGLTGSHTPLFATTDGQFHWGTAWAHPPKCSGP